MGGWKSRSNFWCANQRRGFWRKNRSAPYGNPGSREVWYHTPCAIYPESIRDSRTLNFFFHSFTSRLSNLKSPIMVSFVGTNVMGASFEITDRYSDLEPRGCGSSGMIWYVCRSNWFAVAHWQSNSSARDSISNSTVAIKKIISPFDTPALAKRTYREVHLLSHLRHDNVGLQIKYGLSPVNILTQSQQLINMTDIFISPSEDLYENSPNTQVLRLNDILTLPIQIHCHRVHYDRSSSSIERGFQIARRSIYTVLYLPNAGK